MTIDVGKNVQRTDDGYIIECKTYINGVDAYTTLHIPGTISLDKALEIPPKLKPELIEGVLRQGHKMFISGPSKAGKTFAVMQLALAVATGGQWFGWKCRTGSVLYINLELDENTCLNRFNNICKKMQIDPKTLTNLQVLNLRGHTLTSNDLADVLTSDKFDQFQLVIIDPIYKIFDGAENDQQCVTRFCSAINRIAGTDASVVYVHHHSKGAQGDKFVMDRASGSGVFARDADAMVDMVQLFPPHVASLDVDLPSVWKVETVLREFKPSKPLIVEYRYPLHVVDNSGIYAGWKPRTSAQRGGMATGQIQHGKKIDNIKRFKELYTKLAASTGGPPCIDEISDQLQISKATVRRYSHECGLSVAFSKRGRPSRNN